MLCTPSSNPIPSSSYISPISSTISPSSSCLIPSSSCRRQVEAYDADELNFHGGMRVSFGMQLMGAAARIERHIPDITWPFFLLHGNADKLCDIRGSQMMYEKAQSSDKELKVGVTHRDNTHRSREIETETERDRERERNTQT